jgi:NitT/TauT family transport system ATP-binding protein
MLTFDHVRLVYGAAGAPTEALRNISLSVSEGEFVAIVGPSGCGKSSLLRLALGLQDATAGQVRVDGAVVAGPRQDVGAVYQSPVLLPWRTILENVLLPAVILKLDRRAADAKGRALLHLAGLAGCEDKYPNALSGGMQQRAGIVRALLHDPKVLLMDEPFAALDALRRETMSIELQRIWMQQRKTIVFVTHNIAEAVLLADRVVIMAAHPGRIVTVLDNRAARPRAIESLVAPEAVALAREIRHSLDHGCAVAA